MGWRSSLDDGMWYGMNYKAPDRSQYYKKNRGRHKPSSIIRDSKGMDHRMTHTKLGQQAEERVMRLLGEIYDCPVYVGKGTNGEPDVWIRSSPPIAVEVKTCELIKKNGDLGSVKGFRHSWSRFTGYCAGKRMERVFVIEFRHRGDYLYVWLDGHVIDELLISKDPEIQVFHVDMKLAFGKGKLLMSNKLMLSAPPVKQRSLGDFNDSSYP